MMIEERLAIGHGHARHQPARQRSCRCIRLSYAVTELAARGKDGTVAVLTCSVRRRDISRVTRQAHAIDPEAFVTVEDVRPLHRGYWGA
jgi:uncharacterized protein YebE (UPF0316 family)